MSVVCIQPTIHATILIVTFALLRADRLTPGPPLVPEVIDPTPPPPTLPFPSCGQIVTATNGVITPPGYPTFRHNQRCGWIIALDNPRGYRLRINIQVSVEQRSVIIIMLMLPNNTYFSFS